MNPAETISVHQSRAHCRTITQRHAKTFYFSSFPLPPKKRQHAYAIYAFCRYADDVIDRAPTQAAREQAGHDLIHFINRILNNQTTPQDIATHPWLPAFIQTATQCAIPTNLFHDLIHGVLMDRGPVRIQTWPELETYCYHVASVVGLMMTYIFGLQDRSHEKEAIHLGTAMQLTNILRDVAEDLHNDRIYLPQTELDEFGITLENLRRGTINANWTEFMQFQIRRARNYYTLSEPGIRALPRDGTQFTVWMMRTIYAAILDEIERAHYNVFPRRLHVSTPRKILLLLRSRILAG